MGRYFCQRPQRSAARVVAVRRFETAPGKQAQVDWGHLGTLEIAGQEQKLHVANWLAPRAAHDGPPPRHVANGCVPNEPIGGREKAVDYLPPFGRRQLWALEVGEAFSNNATRCCPEDGIAGEGPSTISLAVILRP